MTWPSVRQQVSRSLTKRASAAPRGNGLGVQMVVHVCSSAQESRNSGVRYHHVDVEVNRVGRHERVQTYRCRGSGAAIRAYDPASKRERNIRQLLMQAETAL